MTVLKRLTKEEEKELENTLEEETSYGYIFDDDDEKEPEKYKYLRRVVRYYNSKYDIEIGERAMKGFELFGKYFPNLWD